MLLGQIIELPYPLLIDLNLVNIVGEKQFIDFKLPFI